MRSFISVDLPDELTGRIKNLQDRLRETNADINYVSPEKVHVTLKFLGDVDKKMVPRIEEKLRNALSGFSEFKASIEGVGVFPNMDYIKVIWLGVDRGEKEFEQLFSSVEQEMVDLGFEEEEHDFVPHATIGRVKSGKNKGKLINKLKNIEEAYIGKIDVNKVLLKKSELKPNGPEYTTLREVDLD